MSVAGDLLASKPWMLAVVLFFAAMLLYSQAATTKALMPVALALGVSPVAAIAAFPCRERSLCSPYLSHAAGSGRIRRYRFDPDRQIRF